MRWIAVLAFLLTASVFAQNAADDSLQTVRLQLVAHQTAVLSSDLPGRVVAVLKREGDSFVAGEPLVALDCEMHQARLNKAQALLNEADKVYAVNQSLDQYGSISVLEMEVSAARLAGAQAEADLMQVLVDRCTVNAPFNGRLVQRMVKPHQYVAEGQQLVSILDDTLFEVELIVPSSWLSWLKTGYSFNIVVDETGKTYPAAVTRITPHIDPISQTVKLFAEITSADNDLISGMSGVANFTPTRGKGK